jgi:hypothetical protein
VVVSGVQAAAFAVGAEKTVREESDMAIAMHALNLLVTVRSLRAVDRLTKNYRSPALRFTQTLSVEDELL